MPVNLQDFSEFQLKRIIVEGAYALQRYGSYRLDKYAYWRIERASARHTIDEYNKTVSEKVLTRSVEALSALHVETKTRPASIKWTTKQEKIGETVTVEAIAAIRPEMANCVDAHLKSGFKFGSTGGVYSTIPNKSIDKIEKLLTEGEAYLNPVQRLNAENIWLQIWPKIIADRAIASITMLEHKIGVPDMFSHGNANAGTGIMHRGRLLKRSDTDQIPARELEWLLYHQAGSALSFAICGLVDPGPGKVWIAECLHPDVHASLGGRSDGDFKDASYSHGLFTTISDFKCRQIFSDGGGLLSNATTEKKYFGKSVTFEIWTKIIKSFGLEETLFPPENFEKLIECWTSHTDLSARDENDIIVVGQDIGMIEPLKSPADSLFCKTFIRIRGKVMPHLSSGAWYTMLAYLIFQIVWGLALKRIGGQAVVLGDDFNVLIKKGLLPSLLSIFQPYVKIKGTDGYYSKILGMMTNRPINGPWEIYVTPRIQKTVSSATQISSLWSMLPTAVDETGRLDLSIPDPIEEAIRVALPRVKTLVYFSGNQADLQVKIRESWGLIKNLTPLEKEIIPGRLGMMESLD